MTNALRSRRYRSTLNGRAQRLLSASRASARRRGIENTLDHAWIVARLKLGCEITGLPFDFSADGSRSATNPYAPSLDRIQPGGPYTKDNCRVVLWAMNAACGSWGFNTILNIFREYECTTL